MKGASNSTCFYAIHFPLNKWYSRDFVTKWTYYTFYSNCIKFTVLWIASPRCNMHFGSLQVLLSKIQSRALLKTMHFLKETKWMMPWIFKTHQRDLVQHVYQLRLDCRVILNLYFYLFYRHFDCHKKIEYQYNAACILVEDLFNPKFLASLQVVQSFYSQIAVSNHFSFLHLRYYFFYQFSLFLWKYFALWSLTDFPFILKDLHCSISLCFYP